MKSVIQLATAELQAVDGVDQSNLGSTVRRLRSVLPYEEMIAHLRNRCGFRSGPDIVNLGPPRTGSSWLFWHFFKSANVTKIPGKEINFLNYLNRRDLLQSKDGPVWWTLYRNEFVPQFATWMDHGFDDLAVWATIALIGPRDWEWYEILTGACGSAQGIDYTPNNISSAPATFVELRARHRGAVLFCILRDPYERALSYFRHLGLDREGLVDEATVTTALFGNRLVAIQNALGDVRCFYFSDLQRDPDAFMRKLCADLRVEFAASESIAAPINRGVRAFVPLTFTQRAKECLLADVEVLRAIAGSTVDDWLHRIETDAVLQKIWV